MKYTAWPITWLLVTILVFAIDRFAKLWVMQHLTYQEPYSILPILNLTLAYNTGAAFGFLHTASGWQNIFLGSIALIASIIIICWLVRVHVQARWLSTGLCLILGGAIGNLWDRIVYGHVIDFLSLHLGSYFFAIFNTADSAVFMGACILMIHFYRQRKV